MTVLTVIQHTLIVATVVFLGGVFWLMLTMCDPYGEGDYVYLKLAEQSRYFVTLGVIAGGGTVLLTILDVIYWRGIFWYLARLFIAIDVVFYFLTALAGTKYFPASPEAVYFSVCPLLLYVLKITLLRNVAPPAFLRTTAWSLFLVSFISAVLFFVYVIYYDNYWNDSTRFDYYRRLGCIPNNATFVASAITPNLTAYLDLIKIEGKCDEAFFFWIAPVIMILFTFAMSGALFMILRAEGRQLRGKNPVDLQVRAFLIFLLLGFLGLWCASGIAAADVGLSSVLFAFTFLFMVIGCSAIVFVQGLQTFASGVKEQPLVTRLFSYTKSDWLRSLLLVIFFPLFFVIIPLAFLNQMGRRYIPMTKVLDQEERKLWLSIEVSSRLRAMRAWHWTSVLTKIIWWGILFFSLSVIAARFINVFFSWLQESFVKYNIGIPAATGIFVAVGFLGLMAPPIPAAPIYIASSVILIPVCQRFGWDFWVAWIYASGISLLTKIIGCIGQQKMIGELWGANSVAVRRAVGVNSTEMKAIKLILLSKRLTVPKVAILVGGPDWPTSVGAGILRTPLIPNIIGTLPVFTLILPLSLSGALVLRTSEGGAWVSGATMALAVSGLSQMIVLAYVVVAIENTIQSREKEIDDMPDDEEVKKFDQMSLKRERLRKYVSQWHFLPLWLKFLMLVGVVCEVASAYLFQLFGSRCFLNFSITDSIEVVLENDVLRIIKPLGWVGIGLVVTGNVVLIILWRWITHRCKYESLPEEEEARLKSEFDDETTLKQDRQVQDLSSPSSQQMATSPQ